MSSYGIWDSRNIWSLYISNVTDNTGNTYLEKLCVWQGTPGLMPQGLSCPARSRPERQWVAFVWGPQRDNVKCLGMICAARIFKNERGWRETYDPGQGWWREEMMIQFIALTQAELCLKLCWAIPSASGTEATLVNKLWRMWGNQSQGEVWNWVSPMRPVPTKAAAKIYIFLFALWFRVDINPHNASIEPRALPACWPCGGYRVEGGHMALGTWTSSMGTGSSRITTGPPWPSFLDFWDHPGKCQFHY